MNNEEFLCNLTKIFWQYYILEPTKEHFEEIFSYFSEQLVLIGTGKHEFFTDVSQALNSLEKNQIEATTISFSVLDEWYECLKISPQVYLVYGGLWARQQDHIEHEVIIDMDTRFSMLYRIQNGNWELVHIHHSMPYFEQQNGEYYPKTLSEQAKEAMMMAKLYEKKSELDLMTEVYNNVSFHLYVQEQMNICDMGNMYLFDIDQFKQVNDTYGHMHGDKLLKLFTDLLKQNFNINSIIGRMGGDEFAVFEYRPLNREQTVQKLETMQYNFFNYCNKTLDHKGASFSVGIVSMTKNQYSFDELYSNADQALYRAKQNGRKTYHWHKEEIIL